MFQSPNAENNEFVFLIDTGASLSLLRPHNLSTTHSTGYLPHTSITLKGITEGTLSTWGLAKITLFKESKTYCHMFQLVNSDTIPYDGIIGLDFLTKFNTILDFAQNKIIFNPIKNNIFYLSPDRQKLIERNVQENKLKQEESEALKNILTEYEQIIKYENDSPGGTKIIQHEIKLTDNIPIKNKIYPLPKPMLEEAQKQVDELLKDKIIRKSKSPYNSPVWIVDKKADSSGKKKYRMVIDYRKLNEKTIPNNYPIPRMDQILNDLGGNKYFSALDLASGFHQICVKPEDIPKTAFTIGNGHYEFLRMPFGLINAPATFQTLMNEIFNELIHQKKCLCYLDDLIILGKTLEEHIKNLKDVLKILQIYNLKINPDKCEFFKTEIKYLGHIITLKGIKPQTEKIININEPKNIKQIQSFLGITGYYRKFIKDYGTIAKPLTNLLKKSTKFEFNTECKNAFNILKNKLTTAPILVYPDETKPFSICTDASNLALGGVLTQNYEGTDMPIAYYSYTLNTAEKKLFYHRKRMSCNTNDNQKFSPFPLWKRI